MIRVLFGITGGIAAFKATSIIRLLTESGHQVKVVPTQNALRFIGATTLEALSHNSVDPDLYADVDSVKHVALGQEAELIIVAPASASFLARYAAGIADDLLGNALLASRATVVVAPAMHTEMWQNAATQANVATLRSRGVLVMEPDSGRLTGADTGAGRMPEPEAIVATALAAREIGEALRAKFESKRVLITAGGTREPIDPVRFIGNHSSGKQGLALAYAAQAAGADVTLIGANFSHSVSGISRFVAVETATDLQFEINSRLTDSDLVIMSAAVSDFHVVNVQQQKIKRHDFNGAIELRLSANPDILAGLVARVRAENLPVVTVGFAAETAGSESRLASLTAIKLEKKGCDVIIANDVSEGAVFGADHNQVYLLDKTGKSMAFSGTKLQVANRILDFISPHLEAASSYRGVR